MQSDVESKAQYDEMTNAQLRELVRERTELADQLGRTWISKANKGQIIYALEANDRGEDMTPKTPEKPADLSHDTRPYFIWKCAVRKRQIVMTGATERVDLHGRHPDKPGTSITIHYGIYIPDMKTDDGKEADAFLRENGLFNHAGNDGFRLATEKERGILQTIMKANIRRSEWVTRLRRVTSAMGLMTA